MIECNADRLLEEGVAVRAATLPALAWKTDRLLDEPHVRSVRGAR